jgi:sigma-E factor negative regulatory protein RseA
VFASVLIGSQWYGLLGSNPGATVNESQLAARHSTIGMVNTLGGSAVNATYGPPATKSDTTRQARAAYNRLARQRLQRYLLPHTEEAALNAPQGMMPYARVAAFRTQD